MADNWIYTIELLIVLGIIVWFLIEQTKYVYRIRIKEVVKGRTIQRTYKAKEYIDEDKGKWLKLAGEKEPMKKMIILPPEECIDIDYKAKRCADCYRFQNGDIVWIKDTLNNKEPPEFIMDKETAKLYDAEKDHTKKKEIKDKFEKEQLKKWRRENNIVTPYQPVTSNQRLGYFANIRKSETRKKTDLKTMLLQNIPLIGFVVVIIALIALYGEIAKPVLTANEQMITISNNNKIVTEMLREINNNQQKIDGQLSLLLENKTNSID